MSDPSLKRIRQWMKRNDLTLDDLGFDPDMTLETLDTGCINSILEAIAEDNARDQQRKSEERDALEYQMGGEG